MKRLSPLLKIVLWPFSALYGCVLGIRNFCYDKGIFQSTHFGKPYTIVIGNLSMGGTGKTPHTEWLIKHLQAHFSICTLSRGYKRSTKGFVLANEQATAQTIGDEPMQYYLKFPDINVAVAEKRVLGVTQIKSLRPQTELVLLDDAFQHRALKADTYILITDYNAPYYDDAVIPAGALRENKSGAQRADFIIVSKCPKHISEQEKLTITKRIQPKAHQQVFFTTIHYLPVYNYWQPNEAVQLQPLHIALVTGIAKPAYLMQELSAQVQSVKAIHFPDHHYFTEQDIIKIKQTLDALPHQQRAILTTEKDLTRLLLHEALLKEWQIPLLVLGIEVQFLGASQQTLANLLISKIQHH